MTVASDTTVEIYSESKIQNTKALSGFRADVWQHVSFPISSNVDGKKETDKIKKKLLDDDKLRYRKYIQHEVPFGTLLPRKARVTVRATGQKENTSTRSNDTEGNFHLPKQSQSLRNNKINC